MKKFSTSIAITLLALLMFNLALAGETPATPKSKSQINKAKALKEGWPNTPAGMTAYGWIEAFNTDEKTMQKFLYDHLTRKSLAERSMRARMSSYRSLVKKYGTLMFIDCVESELSELTATIMAEDTSQHRFIFRVDKTKPHKLEMVGIVQGGHGHRGH
ncbi:MAG: hypothetical protein GY780_18945 [bacterium]|nr:hypothetical protein [bacterium]